VPTTYNLFKLVKVPDLAGNPGQVVLSQGGPELYGQPAQTKVKLVGTDVERGLLTLESEHEMLRRIAGRTYTGEEFDAFYQKTNIEIFIDKNSDLMYSRSSRMAAKDLVDRLNDSYPQSFRAEYVAFDFSVLENRLKELHGIWISQIRQQNVDTVAFFGAGVNNSSLYESIRTLGVASSILIKWLFKGESRPVILSARGSVTFPQPAPKQMHQEMVLAIVEDLLSPAIRVTESKRTMVERRKDERERARSRRAISAK
jgi:hypothetical protein